MKTYYHGSITKVDCPIATLGRKTLDFGQGFYIMSIKEQAERWAKFVASRHLADISPCLNIYEMDYDYVSTKHKVLSFDEYNIEWLDFVVSCRKGEDKWRQYDMIMGGVANDKVIDTVEDYKNGIITASQALGQLKFHKPNNQICISNQTIIDNYLKFKNCIKLPKL